MNRLRTNFNAREARVSVMRTLLLVLAVIVGIVLLFGCATL